MRPSWDDYGISIAQAVSTRADCTRRKVGAIIMNAEHRVVSTGYNGSWPGGPSCLAGECPRAQSDVEPGSSYDSGPGTCIALHSEQNAILYCRLEDRRGSTLYCTDFPCAGCLRLIRGAGIARVVTPKSSLVLTPVSVIEQGDPVV